MTERARQWTGLFLAMGIGGLAALAGCSRREEPNAHPTPSPAASVKVSNSVDAPALPAEAPTVTLSLSVAAGTGTATEVFIVSPELDLRERVASVPADVGCTLGAVESGGWAVWCGDSFARSVATLRERTGVLELTRTGLPGHTRPLPPGTKVSLGKAEASSRTLPEKACPVDAATRRLKAILSTSSAMGRDDADLRLAVVEGGRTFAWTLMSLRANVVCKVGEPLDGTAVLSCGKTPVCSFRGTPGRLDISCGEARAFVLPRCGSVPAVDPGEIARTRSYQ